MSNEQRQGLRRPYAQISGSASLRPDERIVGGDVVVLVDVEPQHLGVLRLQILTVTGGDVVADAPVVGVATVAGRQIELAVRTELHPVAVVIELRPVQRVNDLLDARIGLVEIVLRHRHLGHDVGVGPPQLAIQRCVAAQRLRTSDVELAVGPVVRMERNAEQSLLVEERLEVDELRLDVQERLGRSRPRASMIRTRPVCLITALRPLPSGIETIPNG
jgi:hypothetical protein